jgi:xylulokinase
VLASCPAARPVVVGMSGQMHGVVVCDARGEPLRPAVLWSDRRAAPYLDVLRAALAGRGVAPANPVVSGMAGPTLAALRHDEPGLLESATRLLQPKDWVRSRLTGRVATDPSDASATLLWDFDGDRWSEATCEVFGVDPALLPPIEPSAARAGSVAEGSLLEAGLPVAVGAADVAAALLGAAVPCDETQVSIGTGGQIARPTAAAVPDPTRRTHLFRAATPDRWYAMAAMQNVGIAVEWARSTLGVTSEELETVAAASPPGANGVTFVPFLTGERTPLMDPNLSASWHGLHSRHTRADLVRAIFEGIACSLRAGLDALREAGYETDQAILTGGGSTRGWWRQMLADVLGIPLLPHDATEATVRGAALLGWAAAGLMVNPATAVRRGDRVEPITDYTPVRARYEDAVARQTSRDPGVGGPNRVTPGS